MMLHAGSHVSARRVACISATAAALSFTFATHAGAQDYPNRPIRMIVTQPPGGASDTMARLVSPRLTEALGQTVVIDNRPGANGNAAYATAARAAPDGYTLVVAAAGVAINPSLYREVNFDPVKDFAPITMGVSVPNILVVHPSVAATSVQELIALAKARPGHLVFASAGNGTSTHLALEQLRLMSGINVIHVPYKGGAPALTDIMAGQAQALFSIALNAVPQMKAGKVRALAITSAQRSSIAPELPTVAETGFPGFEVVGWFGWLAPGRTPRPIVERLHREIVRIISEPDMRQRLIGLGADPVANTPQAFAAFIKSEHSKWARVIREAKIGVE
jgi:tripartite-type tricarboxylate transporter receptor subunit TctC